MPHFENLDQYEGKDPRSGKKGIVPIAPHSMQATDYRPRMDDRARKPRTRKVPEFAEVDFQPVSVEQMEKEFKAAGRQRRKARSLRNGGSLWKRLLKFLRSLTRKKPKGKFDKKRGNRRKSPRKDERQAPSRGEQRGDQQGAATGTRRRKKKRSRSGSPQGQQPGSPPGDKAKSGGERRSEASPGDKSGEQKRNRRNRNRRRRGPGPKGGEPKGTN